MSAYYTIVAWNEYQHYKDRDPPWIKLHRDLLTSQTWVTLADASRVLAIACMLIAAGTDNKIPANPSFVRRRAYLDHDPDFAPLVAVGFLELVGDINELAEIRVQTLAPASTSLASDTECSSESEKRREEREQRRGEGEASPKSKSGTRIPPSWRPNDAGRAYAAERGLDPDATADAFTDWWSAANGPNALKRDWDAAFRTWCRRDSAGPGAGASARPVPAARGNDAMYDQLAIIAARSRNDERDRS